MADAVDNIESLILEKKDFTSAHKIDECNGNVVDCHSVMVNSNQDNSENSCIKGIIVNKHPLFGTTLTAVTRSDGTQVFITNNTESCLTTEINSAINPNVARRIFLGNLPEFSGAKTLEFQLQTSSIIEDVAEPSKCIDSTYAQIDIDNGTPYMLLSHKNEEKFWKNQKGNIPDTKTLHPCPREGCSKVYSTPHHLKVHERSHSGIRPYKCSHHKCKKTFSTGYSLKAHSRTHTGEKPYKCNAETCDKSFKTSGDLLKHVRTHTGERPFVCPFDGCGRSFTTSNIRKVHMRTHTGERPYKCSQCPKAFASATNYKNHVRIHSGEKPYVCSIENCDKRFTEYSSLYKHHLVHTQHKPFECNLCHKRYRQSSTLVMHKRTTHALMESQDGMDIFLQAERITNKRRKQSKFTVRENGVLQISEATKDSDDNETQILFVGDPSQLVAFQQMSLQTDLDDRGINSGLEELDVKIDEMEFDWH